MEAAADLLAALSSPPSSSHAGLYSRYAAYLQPFTAHLPTSSQTGRRPPRPPPPDAATALRPLAKRFVPFLSRAVQLLTNLLRATPNSPRGACADDDDLLGVYALVLDCLAGKPYAVLLQRGRFACFLESRGRLSRAGAEAAAALDALRSALSPPTTSTRSRSRRGGAASVVSVILPDPGDSGEAGTDPDVAVLGVELTVCLANCASKGKVKEPATYERVLVLVAQLQPWLR